jgi:predicted RNase H-like HicB family nuclease
MTKSASASRQITGYIILTLVIHEEDGQFASVCPELGTASCGDTVDEALANIREATLQYLSAIDQNGTRERIFRKRNIPIYPVQPEDTRLVPAGTKDIVSSVVLPLLAGGIGGRSGATPAML